MALFATVYAAGPTVTVYSDSKCTKQSQVIQMDENSKYTCYEFTNKAAQGVIFSKDGFATKGFNVWDSQYCDGDQAGYVSMLPGYFTFQSSG